MARARETTVLLTGFEPFDGETVNPSALAVARLHGRVVAGARVHAVVLPCAFGAARRALRRALDRVDPAVTVCVGQAGGRAGITLERVAINVDDARIPDNRGAQPVDRAVQRGGPVGYWSTLPIKAAVRSLREAGYDASVSQTAGTFVCNHVFYALMHALASRPRARGGFVHVPYLPEQAARAGGKPSMALDDIAGALEVVVHTALTVRRDRRDIGGATH
ncbi:MAG: pyroglutamyl-peptidase I [Polyangiales bacterium]